MEFFDDANSTDNERKTRRGRPRLQHYNEGRTYTQEVPGSFLNYLNKRYGKPEMTLIELFALCQAELEGKPLADVPDQRKRRTAGRKKLEFFDDVAWKYGYY